MSKILSSFLFILMVISLTISCDNNPDNENVVDASKFVFSTGQATTISSTTAKLSGSIDLGNQNVELEFSGFVIGKEDKPEINSDSYFTDWSGDLDAMSLNLINLTPSTRYYFRVFGQLDIGVYYGESIPFTTADEQSVNDCPGCGDGIIVDIDGNIYETIMMNGMQWMAKNLNVTHYPDGEAIPLITDNDLWANQDRSPLRGKGDGYCYYNNAPESKYGALYTFAAANSACPTGWRLPTEEEWQSLELFLGLNEQEIWEVFCRGTNEGAKLKASSGWKDEGNGVDTYGYAGLPGGLRSYLNGEFMLEGDVGSWWTSSFSSISAHTHSLTYAEDCIGRTTQIANFGLSVRCVRE